MQSAGVSVRDYMSGDIGVVAASGEIDFLNVEGFRRAVEGEAKTAEVLVVDLREADYIDSAALEVLVAAYLERSKQNRRLAILARQGSQPREVLRVARIDSLMTVAVDPEELGLEE